MKSISLTNLFSCISFINAASWRNDVFICYFFWFIPFLMRLVMKYPVHLGGGVKKSFD